MEIKLHFQTKKTAKGLRFGVIQKIFLGLLLLMSCGVMGQVDITPIRTQVTGFSSWTDSAMNGTNYLQMSETGTQTISPTMDFTGYTSINLDFSAREYGGPSNAQKVITVSVSTDGTTWTTLGTRSPSNTTLTAVSTFSLNTYIGQATTRIRIQALNASGGKGVGIDDIRISGALPLAACSGTPNAGTVTVSPATDGPSSTYTVSATGYASGTSGLSYQWQSNTDGAGWTNSGSATSTYSNRIAIAPATAGSIVEWRLRVTCATSGVSSDSTTAIFTVAAIWNVPTTGSTSVSACTGMLYDSGGSTGNYSSSSSGYTVINPSVAGNLVRVSGSITAEAGYDYLTIYDGVGTAGTVLWGGSAHGTGTSCTNFAVPTITSTTGPLTVRFTSDTSGNCAGFALNINCFTPSATPVLAITGNTNNGSSCPLVAAPAQNYTITNTGTSAATGITVSSSDPQFVVSGLSSATIAGSGGTATYTVTFTPSSAGPKTATITVISATSGSNSPTSNLTGTGTATISPVAVTGAATAISAYAATLNATGGTTFGVCPNTTQKGFVYSQTSVNNDPTHLGTGVITTPVTPIVTTPTAYNSNISGLIAGTSYSYKAYLFDGTNYTYGPIQTFTTLIPPTNDLCASAVGLTMNAAAISGNMTNASVTSPQTGDVDVWYQFTISCDQKIIVNLTNTAGNMDVRVYDACSSTLTIAGSTGFSGTSTTIGSEEYRSSAALPAGTYYVRVSAGNTAAQNSAFTIRVTNLITVATPPISQTTTTGSTAIFTSSIPNQHTSYQWLYSTDGGGTWANVVGGSGATTNSYTTPATTMAMNGWRYQLLIGNGTCNAITVPATASPAILTVNNCAPSSTSSSDYINNFSTSGGLSNISNLSSGHSTSGYGNFYSTHYASYSAGAALSFTETYIAGNHGFKIWVDWNGDGDFNGAGELMFESTSLAAGYTGSFTIPSATTVGDYRMRIRALYNNLNVLPCGSVSWGEAEDYKLTVTAALPPTTYTWTGATNTSWGTATNWSPNGIPGANDSVIISSPGTNGLIINGTQTVTNFTLNGTGNFTMNASGVLTINGNVTYGGTATATLNCASQVNITSAMPQVIPPLIYGALSAAGGDRTLLSGRTVGICYTFNPGAGVYTLDGSTVEYLSSSGYEFNMLPFTYHNLKFSGSDTFTVGIGNTITVLGNFEQTAGIVNIAKSATANNFLNISGDMTISGGTLNLNVTDGGKGTVNLGGDLIVNGTGKIDATVNTDALLINTNFNFKGLGDGSTPATTQTISVEFPDNTRNRRIRFNVKNGSYVKLLKNFDLGNKSVLNIETGGTLDFGFNGSTALVVTGNGRNGTGFTSQSNSTLIVTSPQGIMNTSGNVGNIQTNTAPSIDQTGNFYYVGKENQMTGSGLTSTNSAKNVFVNLANNTLELRLTNPVQINSSGKLEIQKGIVLGEEATPNDKDFYGLGNLIMTDGEYRISTIAANPSADLLPQLSGPYTLSNGTITLNGDNADQVIRNGRTYHNLKIAGTNTLLSNAKKVIVNSGVTVNNQLQITENAIFDSGAHVVAGTANVTMDGNSRWRNARTTTTQPELSGLYNLTGGTMEFYGTSTATSQTIKGIDYYNLDINADAINSDYSPIDDFYNVSTTSSIGLTGNLNVNAPAAFKISSTHNISGEGNIFINPGATLLYGSEYGIKTSGTSAADGAIRVGGTRNFSSDASYGFIGGQGTMVTGNALPATVENLYIAKSNDTDDVTLSNPSLTARNKMYFLKGNIITGSNNFQLGTDAVNKGTLEYTGGFVKGAMTRWFGGANSGDATALFPLGTIDNKTRAARVEFASTTTPGAITASVQNTAMGIAGIAALAPIPTSGLCPPFSVFNIEDFYWNLTPAGISGSYKARFSKEQLTGESICNVTLLNRTATDWTTPGTDPDVMALVGIITAMRSGLTTFSDFGFGNRKCGETKTWTGTWSGGTAPTITNKVVFAANYDSATQGGNVSACECEIQTGVTVTMAGGTTAHNMEIYGKLEGSGTLKLENNASLIQYDNVSNSGNLEMTRNTQPSFRYDYTYWSSPVASQGLHAVSPTTFFDKYFSWNAGLQEWYLHQRPTPWNPAATPLPEDVMRPGKGYIIRAPQTFPVEAAGATPQIFAAAFKGVPNNGVVSIPVAGGTDKYNLIGNPYASAISADAFLQNAANVGTVEGTLYFWTHNTPIAQSGGTGMYSYSAADYAVYNGVGATSTVPGANPGGPNNNPNVPNGNIASGQSFFIKGSATGGSVTFNNSMRLKGNNNQFFRYAAAEALPQPELEKHRIWLNLSNETNGFSQSLIGYVENATNGYDRNFDGELLGGGSVSLYSLLEGDKMAIQGKTLPFDQNDQVPMGFKATAAGNLKVSLDHFDGLFSGQNIYLEDKALDIIHDLKAAPYTFTTTAGTFNERFVVRYTNESLGTGEHSMDANGVIVAVKNKVIKVISAKENIQSIAVFDLLGRAIYENNQVNALSFSTEEIAAQEQVLIVKIVLENNSKADRKIIFK